MPERFDLALKIACVALATLALYEFSQLLSRWNPLGRANVPALPTFSGRTNAEAGVKSTNPPLARMPQSAPADTNAGSPQQSGKDTNAMTSQKPSAAPTNPAPSNVAETRMPMSSPFPPSMMLGMKPTELPPASQARVDRIA